MKLSNNFALSEFLRSQTAVRHDIDMTPGGEVKDNLKRLCENILQPVRDALGSTQILSGYRPVKLNKKIGGSERSQHIKGQAADIVVTGHSPDQVCEFIVSTGLPFDQCILEFGGWCHVSIATEGEEPRGEILTAQRVDGRTKYVEGLV